LILGDPVRVTLIDSMSETSQFYKDHQKPVVFRTREIEIEDEVIKFCLISFSFEFID